MPTTSPRRITLVAYPGIQTLDVTGPHEVFAMANRFAVDPPEPLGLPAPSAAARSVAAAEPYRIEVVGCVAGPDERGAGEASVTTSSGLRLGVDRWLPAARGRVVPLGEADRLIDTLIVPGGTGTLAAATDPSLLAWLRAVAPRARRITSVCSGAFVLAAAGLLDGRRATTHWSECPTLRELFPDVVVEDDPIFVKDGRVYTSAGITAGMDLALALVEEDLGRDLALAVSRWMVMFVQRPGGQSQFSSQLSAQLAERRPLRELQAWIHDHPDADLSVEALAGRLAMSPRHFARVFRDDIGTTPAQYVEQTRVEVARRLLETTDDSVDDVARATGFGTTETMQRAFQRRVHVSPTMYRSHFARTS